MEEKKELEAGAMLAVSYALRDVLDQIELAKRKLQSALGHLERARQIAIRLGDEEKWSAERCE